MWAQSHSRSSMSSVQNSAVYPAMPYQHDYSWYQAKKRDGWIILVSRQLSTVLPYESTTSKIPCPCVLLLWHHLAAGAAPLPKTSTSFLFIKTLTTRSCDITPSSLLPPLPVISWHAPVRLTLSTPHLAHTCHSGQHALVVAFPGNLAKEKVDFIIIWIVGVCNGVSRYKLGLC